MAELATPTLQNIAALLQILAGCAAVAAAVFSYIGFTAQAELGRRSDGEIAQAKATAASAGADAAAAGKSAADANERAERLAVKAALAEKATAALNVQAATLELQLARTRQEIAGRRLTDTQRNAIAAAVRGRNVHVAMMWNNDPETADYAMDFIMALNQGGARVTSKNLAGAMAGAGAAPLLYIRGSTGMELDAFAKFRDADPLYRALLTVHPHPTMVMISIMGAQETADYNLYLSSRAHPTP